MKDLLIKIKAIFEGKDSFDAANGSLDTMRSRLTECMTSGSALGSALGTLASGAIAGLAGKALELVHSVVEIGKGMAEGVVHISSYADKMGELGMRTGQAASESVVMTQAFRNIGLEAGNVGGAINMLQMALTGLNDEGLPTKGVFDDLGLSLEALKDMSPINALQAISEKIAGLESAADKTRALRDLFGRSGPTLLPLLGDNKAFSTAREQVGQLAGTIGRNVDELGKFADAWESLDVKKMQFFAGLAEGLAGSLSQAGDAINAIDMTKFGTDIGDTLNGLVQVSQELQKLRDQATSGVKGVAGDSNTALMGGMAKDSMRALMTGLPGGTAALSIVDGLSFLKSKGASKREETTEAKDAEAAAKDQEARDSAAIAKTDAANKKLEDQKARRAALSKDLADVADAERLKSLPLNDQKAELDKQASAMDAHLQRNDLSKDDVESSTKLRLALEKQRLEVASKITEELKKASDLEKENSAKREALDLELAIKEAQAAGNETLLAKLQWQKEYNALLKAGLDAKDPDAYNRAIRGANASMEDPLAKARDIEKQSRSAVQLSSLGRLGMAMGENSNASATISKLQEMTVAQQKSTEHLSKIASNTEAMAKQRGGYQ